MLHYSHCDRNDKSRVRGRRKDLIDSRVQEMKRNLEDRRAKASHMLLMYVLNLLISIIQAFIFTNIVICLQFLAGCVA